MKDGYGNVSVGYKRDSLNRLSTVTDNKLTGTSNTTTYTYDSASNVVNVAYPNGVKSTLNYDTLNRLTSLTTPNTGYLYTLGATGTRSNVTELTGRAITWNYDGIYRLTNETISSAPSKVNGSVAYGLDPVGNRLSATSSIAGINSGSYTFNADDELTGLNYETYDADGNVLTTAGGKSFAYDSEDHLKSMNGGAVSIVYDGDGDRVEKIANGVVTKYLVDDLNPTGLPQVVEETGSSQRTYTYGLQRIDENQIINGAWTPSFYGYDGMGNVRQLENSAGAITDTYEYDAFGNKIASTGTTPNNYLYRGEQWDPDLGLYYLRARYYNPTTGRFMSRDPNGECNCGSSTGSRPAHTYLYASDDPVNRVDPSGRADVGEETEIDLDITQKAIGQRARAAAIGFGAGVAGGTGLWAVQAAILCHFFTDASAVHAIAQNLGFLQELKFYASGCSASSSRLPYIPPYGDRPAPFNPEEVVTAPGTPWKCNEDYECEAPCPPGSKRDHQKLYRDPGSRGEPPHWDWTDCDGNTWKIYPQDGTMAPA